MTEHPRDPSDLSRYYVGDAGPTYPARRLTGLITEAAEQGILCGRDAPFTDFGGTGGPPGTVADAMPAVREFLDRPIRLAENGAVLEESDPRSLIVGDFTTAQIAVAIVAGARRLLDDVQAIERAAAAIARDHGVTVRELAEAAGITERAAFTRYPRQP